MTKRLASLMAVLALGLGVVACGDDDDDDAGGGGGGGGAPAGDAVEVAMKDIKFNPDSLDIDKGTTVLWTNEDSAAHDVTKTGGPGPDFSSGDPGGMKEGDTFEHTFDTAGDIEYVCTVHSDMTASVTVK